MNTPIDKTAELTEQKKDGVVKAAWVLLILAWIFFLIPFFGWLGWILNLVAFILSIVILAKGETKKGILLLVLSTVASGIIYLISWAVLGAISLSANAAAISSTSF